MSQITIIGLGPGEWKHLTLEAVEVLNQYDDIWLRTHHHPVVAEIPQHLAIHSFDSWYEEADEFAALYMRIAAEVVRLGQREEGVLYAVPGHPSVGEATVAHIQRLAREAKVPLRLIAGLSFIEPSLTAVEADALDGLQIADATTIASRYYPPFDAARPVLIAQLYSQLVASDVKLTLMELFPADHPVTLLQGTGTSDARVLTLPLYQLDHPQIVEFGYLCSLWVPALSQPSALPHLQNIIAHLRAPEGCPWDREQTHQSLRKELLEETYEVLDAIDRESPTELCDELGDLLLMIAMISQIAHEDGEFSMVDIIANVSQKLIRRHPHVFGNTQVSNSAEVSQTWERIKAAERAAKGEVAGVKDEFDEIPAALPALQRGRKITRQALKRGWQAPAPATAFERWQESPDDERLGALLLALTAYSTQHKQEPELLLRDAIGRLIREVRGG